MTKFIQCVLAILLMSSHTVSENIIIDTFDSYAILVDNHPHRIIFNATRSSQSIETEISLLGLSVQDQHILIDKIQSRQQEQLDLRKHAVKIDDVNIHNVIDAAMQQLDCNENMYFDNIDLNIDLNIDISPQLYGHGHFQDVSDRIQPLLEAWDSMDSIESKDTALINVICILLYESKQELIELTASSSHPNPQIYSSAFSYRWLAEPAQAFVHKFFII